MPQMSPMNWLMLNLYFLMIMMILISMIYFQPLNNKFMKNSNMNKKYFNLKW